MNPQAELARLLENLLRYGVIDSVDRAARTCKVRTGALVTAPLKWIEQRAGDARTAWAPSVGEQVLMLCPGGDLARGVVLMGINADATPAPYVSDTADVHVYADGALIYYDPESHQLSATLPAGGKAALNATGGIELTGDVTIVGKLSVSDKTSLHDDVTVDTKLTASTDVIGGGISLKNHKTTGVTSGSSLSGPPQ